MSLIQKMYEFIVFDNIPHHFNKSSSRQEFINTGKGRFIDKVGLFQDRQYVGV